MKKSSNVLSIPVLVAALGYFVDIYDLVLFSIVRKKSLLAIGIAETDLEKSGLWLLNIQMVGMLVGGLIWGIIGDKKGRLSVLFGSIIMYSVANTMRLSPMSLPMACCGLSAGVGLAGELGAGITLVSEILHKDKRGWGTTIVATVGGIRCVIGRVGRAQFCIDSYIVGGVLGLVLLIMRFGVFESGMYQQAKDQRLMKWVV